MVQQRQGHGTNEVMGTPSEVKQFNQRMVVVLLNTVRFSACNQVSFQHRHDWLKPANGNNLEARKQSTVIHSADEIHCDADKSMGPRLMFDIERVK